MQIPRKEHFMAHRPPSSPHSITLAGRELSYMLTYKKVKNINLRVHADGTVAVSSPFYVSIYEVERVLTEKSAFLLRALDRYAALAQKALPVLCCEDGAKLSIFGVAKTIHLVTSAQNHVKEDGETLYLELRNPADASLRQRTLRRYLDDLCRETIAGLCENVYPLFSETLSAAPTLRFRAMRARWGSCRPTQGILTFNKALVFYPISCIEYVVMHEFTHFLHPNPSARFYAALAEHMPDWKERKALLASIPMPTL